MQLKLIIRNFDVIYKNKTVYVDVYETTRGGTKSPVSYYYHAPHYYEVSFRTVLTSLYVSEYEMRIRGYEFNRLRILVQSRVSPTPTYGTTMASLGQLKSLYANAISSLYAKTPIFLTKP